MKANLRIAAKYLGYRLQAGGRHRVHSPFVYALLEDVLLDSRNYYAFGAIEKRRQALYRDERSIRVRDYGAGSLVDGAGERRIADIARHAAKPPKFGRLLFRLVQRLQPDTVLELGTSLGISTAYMAAARSAARVVTLEGCPETAAVARQTFSSLALPHIEVLEGHFDDTLATVLRQLPRLDMAFLDGNHRKEPTLRYFSQCLTRTHADSVLVFDDIHWTRDMEEAWEEIKAHPSVTLSIDLFFMGLVFFREEIREKQHFILRY